jgi:hypothetical protein
MGKLSALAAPDARACQYHLRHPRPASPARPLPRPGGRKASPQGWQRRFLRYSAVRKSPKDTGSRRRLSPQRLEDHAALLVVQALAAQRASRPTAWLALVMYQLDTQRPAGASRVDARDNIARLAGVLAVSADWRSGRRGRPGRQVAAALLGRAERTITRHLALLEQLGLARRDFEGDLLDAEQRAEAREDEDVSPAQRERWTNRAEFTLIIPAWVREITDAQLAPYVDRAAALLDELAAPARPVDNRADQPVDKRPGPAGKIGSVTPSRFFKVVGSLPLRRGFFSYPVAVEKPAPAPTGAEPEKGHKGGASRHSPTREPRSARPLRMAPWAVRLARQIVQDGRLPVDGYRHMPALVSVLKKALSPLWQLDDVLAEARLRLRETGKPLLTRPDRPIKYIEWLLAAAVPDEPPAQITAAAAAAVKDRAAERARERREQEAAAAVARATGSGIHQARQMAQSIAERRRQQRLDSARGE